MSEKEKVHRVDDKGTRLIKKALRCMIVMGQMDITITPTDVADATELLKDIDKTQLSGSNTEVDEKGNQLGN